MVTSYIIYTYILFLMSGDLTGLCLYIYILSISPQPAALEAFNGAISTSNLLFLLQLSYLNASFHASLVVQFTYIRRIESLFPSLKA